MTNVFPFRFRANILQLLGDQLIGNSRLAIFELVKNAYDADADKVVISISNIDNPAKTSIEICDYGGCGMDYYTIKNIWLEPGNDHKKQSREQNRKTPKGRFPLGEKGLGRFAVHKLGNIIKVNTRSYGNPEFYVEINWSDQLKYQYVDETQIVIKELSERESYFKEQNTGTRIIITDLHSKISKADVQDIYRTLNSLKSPFESSNKISNVKDHFEIELIVPEHPEWLENLVRVEDVLNYSMYRFSFAFINGKISYHYSFNPNNQLQRTAKVSPRNCEIYDEDLFFTGNKAQKITDIYYKDIGDFYGEFYVYDFDNEVKANYTNLSISVSEIQKFLRENGGVRIYRDGIRVYNYGEASDDWLSLDERRINRLSKGINKRLILGAIELSLENTKQLIEKTNREGFVENEAYNNLRNMVLSILALFENERTKDRNTIKNGAIKNIKNNTSVDEPIKDLQKALQKKGLLKDFELYIKKIENSYNQMKDIMISSGIMGLNTSIAFHEINHSFKNLKRIVSSSENIYAIKKEIDRIDELLNAYARLLTKGKVANYKLSEILKDVVELNNTRFRLHDIKINCPVITGQQEDFEIKGARHLLIGILGNIVDNAIYWLDARWNEDNCCNKYLYIGVTGEFERGPAIVIADNGRGFQNITPEQMVSPFITTKPGGMGIGLYFVNTVMNMMEGEVLFLQRSDLKLNIPEQADGAVVVLVFNNKK